MATQTAGNTTAATRPRARTRSGAGAGLSITSGSAIGIAQGEPIGQAGLGAADLSRGVAGSATLPLARGAGARLGQGGGGTQPVVVDVVDFTIPDDPAPEVYHRAVAIFALAEPEARRAIARLAQGDQALVDAVASFGTEQLIVAPVRLSLAGKSDAVLAAELGQAVAQQVVEEARRIVQGATARASVPSGALSAGAAPAILTQPVPTGPPRPSISADTEAMMRENVESIVALLKQQWINATEEALMLGYVERWAAADEQYRATTGYQGSAYLDRFLALLKMRTYTRSTARTAWIEQWASAYDDLWHELEDERLARFRELVARSQKQATTGPETERIENFWAKMGKQEAMGLFGTLHGISGGLVGTVDTLAWAVVRSMRAAGLDVKDPYSAAAWLDEQYRISGEGIFGKEYTQDKLLLGMSAGEIGKAGGGLIWNLAMMSASGAPGASRVAVPTWMTRAVSVVGTVGSLKGVEDSATQIADQIKRAQTEGRPLSSLLASGEFWLSATTLGVSIFGAAKLGSRAEKPGFDASKVVSSLRRLLLEETGLVASGTQLAAQVGRIVEVGNSDLPDDEKEKQIGQLVVQLIGNAAGMAESTRAYVAKQNARAEAQGIRRAEADRAEAESAAAEWARAQQTEAQLAAPAPAEPAAQQPPAVTRAPESIEAALTRLTETPDVAPARAPESIEAALTRLTEEATPASPTETPTQRTPAAPARSPESIEAALARLTETPDVAPARAPESIEAALTRLTEAAEPGPRRPDAGKEPAQPGPRGSEPPVGAINQAARDAAVARLRETAATGGDAAVEAATKLIREVADWRGEMRRLAGENGPIGKAGVEALVEARNQMIDRILADLQQRYPGVKAINVGSKGVGSDVDVTFSPKEPPSLEDPAGMARAVRESGAASREFMAELRKIAGGEPDVTLDTNAYTYVGLEAQAPGGGRPSAAVTRQIDVASLAEIQRAMVQAHGEEGAVQEWANYRNEALRRATAGGEQNPIARDLRETLQRQFREAEDLSTQLSETERSMQRVVERQALQRGESTDPAATMARAREQLAASRRADLVRTLETQPLDMVKVRRLQSEIKLLEPGAYASGAAIEDVVFYQQTLRGASRSTRPGERVETEAFRQEERARAEDVRRRLESAKTPEERLRIQQEAERLQQLRRSELDVLGREITDPHELAQSASSNLALLSEHMTGWVDEPAALQDHLKAVAKYCSRIEHARHAAGMAGDIPEIMGRFRNADGDVAAREAMVREWASKTEWRNREFVAQANHFVEEHYKWAQTETIRLQLRALTMPPPASTATATPPTTNPNDGQTGAQ